MSSAPPPYTPGGTPPPYDPRTQWRIYREQQKAAWRAQRDAWKAQQKAMKAGYAGAYAPRVPSIVGPIILIVVGIVGLLLYSGRLTPAAFWSWYGRWWPLLLIGAGLALLAEWALDLRRATPVRRSAGFVGILIVLAILGFAASAWHQWGPMRAEWGDNNDNFFNMLGLPQRDFDQPVQSIPAPPKAIVNIENPRGDISVSGGDGPNIDVQAHAIAFATSDEAAKKIFDSEAANVTVSGNTILVKSEGNSSGRVNLTITVPKSAQVTVDSGRGDVILANLGAGATITSRHGDVRLSAIDGSVQAHFSSDRGDFSAHQLNGDLTADGKFNDITCSEIKGKVTLNGEMFGDVHLENIASPIHLHTSITELDIEALPGDMTLDSDNLRVTQVKGQVRVTTRAKDVSLNQIAGDTYVRNSRGQISIEPAGVFNIEARNGKGDVEITLPPNASATVDGRTQNGDIVTDFPLTITGDTSKTVSGRIGAGKAKITLSADIGDLRISKGTESNLVPPLPPPPPPPNAPHLKAPNGAQQQPVTQ